MWWFVAPDVHPIFFEIAQSMGHYHDGIAMARRHLIPKQTCEGSVRPSVCPPVCVAPTAARRPGRPIDRRQAHAPWTDLKLLRNPLPVTCG